MDNEFTGAVSYICVWNFPLSDKAMWELSTGTQWKWWFKYSFLYKLAMWYWKRRGIVDG